MWCNAEATPPSDGTYVVKRGQTLRDVAEELFGDRERWKEIYEQNKDRLPDANSIREGMALAYKMVGAAAQVARAEQPTQPTQPAQTAPAAQPAPTPAAIGRSYTVGKGDTLYGIARKELGSGARWQEIVALNSLPSEHVKAGTVLRLP